MAIRQRIAIVDDHDLDHLEASAANQAPRLAEDLRHGCLTIEVGRRLPLDDVVQVLEQVISGRDTPRTI